MSSVQDRRNARKRPMRHKPTAAQHAPQRGTDRPPQRGTDRRANWLKLRDSYLERARSTAAAGDSVTAENFYQHAEHYHRMLNADGDRV